MTVRCRCMPAVLVLLIGSLIGCVSPAALDSTAGTVSRPPVAAAGSDFPLFVLADPQLHNVFGKNLRQMSDPADLASKVAERPAELNLLAPVVLWHVLAQARSGPSADAPLVVMLGDGTNVACAGEFDDLMHVVEQALGELPLLAAHGNHDSYLMGTVNDYFPVDSAPMPLTAERDVPADEPYFPAAEPDASRAGSWADACFRPQSHSDAGHGPMHKARWMAKYLEHLKRKGHVDVRATPVGLNQAGTATYTLASTPVVSGPLKDRGFALVGRYHKPDPDRNLRFSYNSYLVQAVDVDSAHRLILIDTSLCNPITKLFAFTNAGSNHCVGDDQLDDISKLVDDARCSGKHLIVAGHAPLAALKHREREKLIETMSGGGRQWTYLSGHTHAPATLTAYHLGEDLNIGSTTDWPMEAHWLAFDASSSRLNGVRTTSLAHHYRPRYRVAKKVSVTSELCRHLFAARQIAAARYVPVPTEYDSPVVGECLGNGRDWKSVGVELWDLRAKIWQRALADEAYRSTLLGIAAAASEAEDRTVDLLGLAKRFRPGSIR